MLIDDSQEDLFLAKRLFDRAGISSPVMTMSSGDDAIAFLHAASQPDSTQPLPFVIYCDVKMPAQSGFDVLQWVRNHSTLRHLPFFMLSGADLESDKERAQQLGATGYLAKFPTPDLIKQTIDSAQVCLGWSETPGS